MELPVIRICMPITWPRLWPVLLIVGVPKVTVGAARQKVSRQERVRDRTLACLWLTCSSVDRVTNDNPERNGRMA